MKNIEKCQTPVHSAQFHDFLKELVDVDFLFKETNKHYGRFFLEKNLVPSFDFSNRFNKRLYTNEFIKTLCEFIKDRSSNYTLYFYSNLNTKDKFRNQLIGKIKSIFGFKVWEESMDLETFVDKVENMDCGIVSGLELFFDSENSGKPFKHIRKQLEKNGMNYLNDVYFEDLRNKMLIFC